MTTAPQIVSCPYRTPASPSGNHCEVGTDGFCALLGTVLDVQSLELTRVSQGICRGCLASDDPTTTRFNRFFASAVVNSAERVIANNGIAECSASKAKKLRHHAISEIVRTSSIQQNLISHQTRPRRVGRVHEPALGTWRWAYGVTVTSRPTSTLQRSLDSLRKAGFPSPHIFADGKVDVPSDLVVTRREHQSGAWPNWILSAHELYQRDPHATAYALFQDDILLTRNVATFLENTHWPDDGYLNLYTATQNGRGEEWFRAVEPGKGALALVFSNSVFRKLLTSSTTLDHRKGANGHKRIDVAVSNALAESGIVEFVHDPSLVQHQVPKTVVDVPYRNSTLGHNYGAHAPSFPEEHFDCMTLIPTPQRRVVTKKTPRIGLVGYNTASGIGSCNRDICAHLPIDHWLIVRHPTYPTLEQPSGINVDLCADRESQSELVDLCQNIDILLTVETEFIRNQSQIARRLGVVTVCVPMIEWLPKHGWPQLIDTFLCPTRESFAQVNAEHPGRCHEFLWPVDTHSFAFRERTKCERFVFINGHGGHSSRKGGDVVRRALSLAPDIHLIVYDQTNTIWPDGCDVRAEAPTREALYRDGDVLIFPARFNGIGLEQLEAMASGLPVIATDAAPMSESVCLDLIRCDSSRVAQSSRPRTIPIHEPDSSHLAELLRKWHCRDVSESSHAARAFAELRSWTTASDVFMAAIKS